MIAVIGASGQIGRALCQHGGGSRIIGLARPEADLGDPNSLARLTARLDRLAPSALINTAAYTQVDRAESEPELAMRINSDAPAALARWAADRGIPFVHYSTDYVFPGTGTRPWTEEDSTQPLNTYGKTKLQGERGVASAGGRFLVFRTSWVYDREGKNFLNTMLRLGREKESLSVVSDQIGAPSFARDLAEASLRALGTAGIASKFPSGIYHLTNSGETSWHGFATAIFEEARTRGIPLKLHELRAIPSSEYPIPARRPMNSRLSNEHFEKTFRIRLRPWREALHACMQEKTQS